MENLSNENAYTIFRWNTIASLIFFTVGCSILFNSFRFFFRIPLSSSLQSLIFCMLLIPNGVFSYFLDLYIHILVRLIPIYWPFIWKNEIASIKKYFFQVRMSREIAFPSFFWIFFSCRSYVRMQRNEFDLSFDHILFTFFFCVPQCDWRIKSENRKIILILKRRIDQFELMSFHALYRRLTETKISIDTKSTIGMSMNEKCTVLSIEFLITVFTIFVCDFIFIDAWRAILRIRRDGKKKSY